MKQKIHKLLLSSNLDDNKIAFEFLIDYTFPELEELLSGICEVDTTYRGELRVFRPSGTKSYIHRQKLTYFSVMCGCAAIIFYR